MLGAESLEQVRQRAFVPGALLLLCRIDQCDRWFPCQITRLLKSILRLPGTYRLASSRSENPIYGTHIDVERGKAALNENPN